MRAESSGITLSSKDAAIVKGMLARGDRQHDIAAWFGVNGGRIGEISKGAKFNNVAAQTEHLPPPGPYLSAATSHEQNKQLKTTKAALNDIIPEVEDDELKAKLIDLRDAFDPK